jgi:hypothetical protein
MKIGEGDDDDDDEDEGEEQDLGPGRGKRRLINRSGITRLVSELRSRADA